MELKRPVVKVAQVVQQVVGQEALPAAEHVTQEIQPAAAQVPQQVVGQAKLGKLEVEYVYFCRFCLLLLSLYRLVCYIFGSRWVFYG